MRPNSQFASFIIGLALALLAGCSSNSPSQTLETLRASAKPEINQSPVHLYRVQVSGKYGYIDRTGRIVIPAHFYRAEDFSEGLAAVSFDSSYPGKWGYVDQTGRFVIAPRFPDAHNFSSGLALVNLDLEHRLFIDKTGKETIRPEQLIGDRVKSVAFEDDFRENMASIWIEKPEGGRSYGYINPKGEVVIDALFDRAFPFQEGTAEVISFNVLSGNGMDTRALIDKTGRTVADLRELCPRIFAGEIVFSEGLAPAKTSCFANAWGFIDHSGQFVIKPQFASASIFREDLAIVGYELPGARNPDAGSDLDGLRLFGDVTHQKPSASGGSYLDGLRVFGDGGLNYPNMKYGYIHKSGVLVIPARGRRSKRD